MILNIDYLVKKYQGKIVLNIDNLHFNKGEVCSIIGPNGSAKSTLLRIIAGIIKQDEGTYKYINNTKISYMPQKPYIFNQSVLKNIMLSTNSIEKAKNLLQCAGLDDYLYRKATNLSGGEMQRLALVRTFASNANVFILDEPMQGIDLISQRKIEEYICFCRNNPETTIIFSTHDMEQALRLSDKSVYLKKGNILCKGIAKDVIAFAKNDGFSDDRRSRTQ